MNRVACIRIRLPGYYTSAFVLLFEARKIHVSIFKFSKTNVASISLNIDLDKYLPFVACLRRRGTVECDCFRLIPVRAFLMLLDCFTTCSVAWTCFNSIEAVEKKGCHIISSWQNNIIYSEKTIINVHNFILKIGLF